MPRLRQVPRSAASDQRGAHRTTPLFGEPRPGRRAGHRDGTPGNWWTVFALVPDALSTRRWLRLLPQPKRACSIPTLRELGQARAGWAHGQPFVFSSTARRARSWG